MNKFGKESDLIMEKNFLSEEVIIRLQDSIDEGLNYLNAQFISNKGWSDFQTNSSGSSDSWISAFIAWQSGKMLTHEQKTNLRELLNSYIQEDKGIGYSLTSGTDCDSTTHFINACLELGVSIDLVSNQIKYILNHQKPDGGFSTYNKENIDDLIKTRKYKSYSGWLSSHNCVSAVVFETLARINFINNSAFSNLIDYIVDKQNNMGFWDSYWWHSRFFATSKILNVIRSQNLLNKPLEIAYQKGLDFILSNFNNGYWGNGYNNTPCIISTCMSASVFVNNADIKHSENVINKVVDWLISKQNKDGSWLSNPIFQIPPPDLENPSNFQWRFDKHGVGSCTNDQNNLYTTSLVINFLNSCLS